MVRVPVKSVQRMDMQRGVSMVARFLTRTLCFTMRLTIIVRDNTTHTGRPYTMNT